MEIYLVEPGIICVRPLYEDIEFDVEDGVDLAHAYDALAGGKAFAALLDVAGKNASATNELRKYGAGKNYSSFQVARAITVDSFMTRFVANHFVKTFRPGVTTQLFAEREPALEWLRGRMAEYEKVQRLK